ncbi:MAG: PstS family phosphate ABC transporter substrate-binding protein [Candidatus Aminicenantes bacterium]|nr:PstS family phosphate ABC transporter substrate-binding protein [Candidatus Aminicenantes bacterium]
MNKAIISLLAASFLIAPISGQTASKPLEGSISISGAWALYPMVLKWAEEFKKIHPRVKIDVQAGGAGKGMADVLAGMADLGMVSRDINPEEMKKGASPFAVTKDGVVATASAKNPFLGELLKKGLTRQQFIDIWISGKDVAWGRLLGTGDKSAVHVFTRSDACGAAETWAAYLGKKQEDLGGIGVYGDPGLAEAVRRDPLGIGFNNINFAYDARTLKPVEGIAIVPIDLDGSGGIEDAERFTATRDEITGAIARKVYPSPPARDLYLVSKGRPASRTAVEFLRWVLTDGQTYVPETGYIRLGPEKLKEGLDKLK